MYKFLLQKENGYLSEDVNTVRECIEEYNWLNNNSKNYKIQYASLSKLTLLSQQKNLIPVGSIEFVETYLKLMAHNAKIKPILIPSELRAQEFTMRQISIVQGVNGIQDIFSQFNTSELFVKSATCCKTDFTDIYTEKEINILPDDRYCVSECINIISEWRVFVLNGKIQRVCNYSGDDWVIPNKNAVQKMIDTYKKCPPAYTLDVAVIEKDGYHYTVIIEIHNFISCGLYGFHSTRIPTMLIRAFKYEMEHININKLDTMLKNYSEVIK